MRQHEFFVTSPPKIDKSRRSSIELSIVVGSSSILQVGNKTFPIFWNLISSKNFSVFKSFFQLPGGLTMSIVQKHVPHEEIQRQNGMQEDEGAGETKRESNRIAL